MEERGQEVHTKNRVAAAGGKPTGGKPLETEREGKVWQGAAGMGGPPVRRAGGYDPENWGGGPKLEGFPWGVVLAKTGDAESSRRTKGSTSTCSRERKKGENTRKNWGAWGNSHPNPVGLGIQMETNSRGRFPKLG